MFYNILFVSLLCKHQNKPSSPAKGLSDLSDSILILENSWALAVPYFGLMSSELYKSIITAHSPGLAHVGSIAPRSRCRPRARFFVSCRLL